MNQTDKRASAAALAVGLLLVAFYGIILFYFLFAVLRFDLARNFVTCMTFELIGLVLTAAVVINGLLRRLRVGYLVPMAILTVVYAVLRNVLSIAGCIPMKHTWFLLLHLILLFVYLAGILPMYLMGIRKAS